MPFLMVDLDNPRDCRRAMEHLQNAIGGPGPHRPGPGEQGPKHRGGPARHRPGGRGGCRPGPDEVEPTAESELPLRKKLNRISRRGIWTHLVRIALEVNEPMSLPELDQFLDLAKNKMRSLKAIMGKLERRWGLEFLITDPDGSVDDAGNPRYIMPAPLRRQIRQMSK